MNLNLFETEQLKKNRLFCKKDFIDKVIKGDIDTLEIFYKMELTEEDIKVCREIAYTHKLISEKKSVDLTSKFGDFFNIWTWVANYYLFPMEGSYKRFLVRRGIKESIDSYQTFKMVWEELNVLYGWSAK